MILFLSILLTLGWNANKEPDLAGYQVYWRSSPPERLELDGAWQGYTNVGNVTRWQTDVEPNKFYYFAVTAYNTAGAESDFSRMVIVIFVGEVERP